MWPVMVDQSITVIDREGTQVLKSPWVRPVMRRLLLAAFALAALAVAFDTYCTQQILRIRIGR